LHGRDGFPSARCHASFYLAKKIRLAKGRYGAGRAEGNKRKTDNEKEKEQKLNYILISHFPFVILCLSLGFIFPNVMPFYFLLNRMGITLKIKPSLYLALARGWMVFRSFPFSSKHPQPLA